MFLQVASYQACHTNSDKLVVTSTELHPVPVITTWYHVAIDFIGHQFHYQEIIRTVHLLLLLFLV